MANERFRVVLDTNQIVAAGTRFLVHGRPSPDPNVCRRILIRVAESHTGLYCGKVIGEYLEKLVDYKHPPERALKLITFLMGSFTFVEITTDAAPFPPADPDDEIFLLCALDGRAHYLVSDDAALLNLRANYQQVTIGGSVETAPALGA